MIMQVAPWIATGTLALDLSAWFHHVIVSELWNVIILREHFYHRQPIGERDYIALS